MSRAKFKSVVLSMVAVAVIAAVAVWAAVATRGGETDTGSALAGPEAVPGVPGVSEGGASEVVSDSEAASGSAAASDSPEGSATESPARSEEVEPDPVQGSDHAEGTSTGSDDVAAAKLSAVEQAGAAGLSASVPVVEPGDEETDMSPGPREESVLPMSGQQQGQMFIWYDGDREMRVWLQQDLTVNAAGDVVPREAGSDASGGSGSEVVFASESGSFMTLPGGVIVVFERELSKAEAEVFFGEVGVSMADVSKLDSLPNGWFVDTAPGLDAINLANTIADQDGVLLSSPNWKMDVAPQ